MEARIQCVRAVHRHFSADLPLAMCDTCARGFRPAWHARLRNWLASLHGIDRRAELLADRTGKLRAILAEIDAYHELLQLCDDIQLSLADSERVASESPRSLGDAFANSIRLPRQSAWGMAEQAGERPVTAGLIKVVADAIVQLIDRTLLVWAATVQPACHATVQICAVILPGRLNRFEIQGLGRGLGESLDKALRDAIPSWPVDSPFIVLVHRSLAPHQPLSQRCIERPFATWKLDRTVKLGQALLQQFGVAVPDEPTSVDEADIVRLRHHLPDNLELAKLHAEFLAVIGRHEESLAVIDWLIGREPANVLHRHQKIAGLEAAGKLLHAAASCQGAMAEFPHNVNLMGQLAHLQNKLHRPEDAIETATAALRRREQPNLYHVRAVSYGLLGQLNRVLSDLNVAVFMDATFAPAYLLRARAYLRMSDCASAIAQVELFHRHARRTLESTQLLATARVQQGNPDAAVGEFDELVRQEPDNPEMRLARAECLASVGRLADAKLACDQVIAGRREVPNAYVLRAAIQLDSGDPHAALRDVDRADELRAPDPRLSLIRGLANAQAGHLEVAERELTAACELDGDNTVPLFHRGCVRVEQKDYARALEDFDVVLERSPNWALARVRRGFLYLLSNQPDESLADFEVAVREDGQLAEARWGRALVRRIRGNLDGALQDLNEAVRLDPHNVAYRLCRTDLLVQASEPDAAKADLDSALAAVPDSIPALFRRAYLSLKLSDPEAAKRDFDAILRIDPDAVSAVIGRSVANEQAGNVDDADQDLNEALRMAPADKEQLEYARLMLAGGAAFESEQFDKAIEYASQAIEHEPGDLNAYRLRASAYWYAEDFVEALADYSHAIDNSPEPAADDLISRGQVYVELGEFAMGLQDLDRGIAMTRAAGTKTSLAFGLNGRGRALAGLDRQEEAEVAFAESLQLKPDNAWLHYNRGLLRVTQADQAGAAVCFQAALESNGPRLAPRKRARARGFLEQ